MNIVDHPSPNSDSRNGQRVDMLVMHYTEMPTAKDALEKLCNPTPGGRVSAHYLVDEDGTVFRLVPEEKRAWHAGVSSWRGATDINARSIGIEIANTGDVLFTEPQMLAVAELSRDIIERHGIPSWNVVGHSDVAPDRKADPGEHFDWQWLAGKGVGMWPIKNGRPDPIADPLGWAREVFLQGMSVFTSSDMEADLRAFGYNVPRDDNEKLKQVVVAFQRHFRPTRVDGVWDDECRLLLNDLLEHAPSATLAAPDGRMAALSAS